MPGARLRSTVPVSRAAAAPHPRSPAMTEARTETSAARATVSGAHLVGSVNLPTAEEVIRTVAEHLGDHVARIPDGEVGERYYWLQFQTFRLERTPGLVRQGATPYLIRGRFDQRPFALDGSVAAEDLVFPDLGYADAAIASFATFAALQDSGVVPRGVRFQVSLPTPLRSSACSWSSGTARPSSPRTSGRSSASWTASSPRSPTTASRSSGTPPWSSGSWSTSRSAGCGSRRGS